MSHPARVRGLKTLKLIEGEKMLCKISKLVKSITVLVVIGFQIMLYAFFAIIQAAFIASITYLITPKLFYPVFFITFIICFIYHLCDKIVFFFQ